MKRSEPIDARAEIRATWRELKVADINQHCTPSRHKDRDLYTRFLFLLSPPRRSFYNHGLAFFYFLVSFQP